MDAYYDDAVWMIVVGFITSFFLAFAVGANDVANSFGTSVGSRALTLGQACILASIFETLGAILIGAKVSDTIRKGLFDPTLYEDDPLLLMVGQISALLAATIWIFIATALKLPVSGTHSSVGAVLGYHLAAFGGKGVDWIEIIKIILSWFVSPVLAGAVSIFVFWIFRETVIKKEEPLEPGLISMPFWYAVVVFINFFSIFIDTEGGMEDLPIWAICLISFGIGFVIGLVVWFVFVPILRRRILVMMAENDGIKIPEKVETKETTTESVQIESVQIESVQIESVSKSIETNQNGEAPQSTGKKTSHPNLQIMTSFISFLDEVTTEHEKHEGWETLKDIPCIHRLCMPLQILSSIFSSFAHGGNDVSNSIGPFVALFVIYTTGDVEQEAPVPVWILFYGAVGMTIGLWALGRRVIETVGDDLTPLTPSSGFTIELGSATTVLTASNLGLPVSTTHCKVGAIVAVGWFRNRTAVDWKLFKTIFLAWIVTLPATIGLSAGFMACLQLTIRDYVYPTPTGGEVIFNATRSMLWE
ncbi:sodium-dependent phosphate transporter 2-like [Antedon mediterranea]|uniref:sodium-dependent phosphate transporter 2-like n=1 Tax=Antedon mediterranea TaxID=105859 RepID=UPI003AF655FE